jgi:pyruvate dehydrogenase E1 component
MNENYAHPAMPEGAEEGVLKGMYRLQAAKPKKGQPVAQLLGSGTILREVIAAAEMLAADWGVASDVWSVTSFTELRRDGLDTERHNRLHPGETPRRTWVEQCLDGTAGPIVAATDYMRAVPDMARTWMPRRYVTLGTDGFGRSDTRANLRRFFEVDRENVVIATLAALANEGRIGRDVVARAIERYGIDTGRVNPWDA